MEKKTSLHEKYLQSKNTKSNDVKYSLESNYKFSNSLNNNNNKEMYEMNTSCFNSEINDLDIDNNDGNLIELNKNVVFDDIISKNTKEKVKRNEYNTQSSIENIYYKTFNISKIPNNEYTIQKNMKNEIFDKTIGNTKVHSKKYEKKTTMENSKNKNKKDKKGTECFDEKIRDSVEEDLEENDINNMKTSIINSLLVSNNHEKIRFISDISHTMESIENSIDKTLNTINNLRKSQINTLNSLNQVNHISIINNNSQMIKIKENVDIDRLYEDFINEEKSINEIMIRNGLKPKLRSKTVYKENSFLNNSNMIIRKTTPKNNGALQSSEEVLQTNTHNTYYNHRFKEEEANTKINRLYKPKIKTEENNDLNVKKLEKNICLEEIYSKQMNKYKCYLNKK